MKKVLLFSVLALVILCQSVFAASMDVVGGVRDGWAVGIMGEQNMTNNLGVRYGLEANTGNQPMIMFVGGKFYVTDSQQPMPLALGFGFVGYLGSNNSTGGLSLSIIVDRVFTWQPLFIEAGVDVVEQGRFQLQLGYKIQ